MALVICFAALAHCRYDVVVRQAHEAVDASAEELDTEHGQGTRPGDLPISQRWVLWILALSILWYMSYRGFRFLGNYTPVAVTFFSFVGAWCRLLEDMQTACRKVPQSLRNMVNAIWLWTSSALGEVTKLASNHVISSKSRQKESDGPKKDATPPVVYHDSEESSKASTRDCYAKVMESHVVKADWVEKQLFQDRPDQVRQAVVYLEAYLREETAKSENQLGEIQPTKSWQKALACADILTKLRADLPHLDWISLPTIYRYLSQRRDEIDIIQHRTRRLQARKVQVQVVEVDVEAPSREDEQKTAITSTDKPEGTNDLEKGMLGEQHVPSLVRKTSELSVPEGDPSQACADRAVENVKREAATAAKPRQGVSSTNSGTPITCRPARRRCGNDFLESSLWSRGGQACEYPASKEWQTGVSGTISGEYGTCDADATPTVPFSDARNCKETMPSDDLHDSPRWNPTQNPIDLPPHWNAPANARSYKLPIPAPEGEVKPRRRYANDLNECEEKYRRSQVYDSPNWCGQLSQQNSQGAFRGHSGQPAIQNAHPKQRQTPPCPYPPWSTGPFLPRSAMPEALPTQSRNSASQVSISPAPRQGVCELPGFSAPATNRSPNTVPRPIFRSPPRTSVSVFENWNAPPPYRDHRPRPPPVTSDSVSRAWETPQPSRYHRPRPPPVTSDSVSRAWDTPHPSRDHRPRPPPMTSDSVPRAWNKPHPSRYHRPRPPPVTSDLVSRAWNTPHPSRYHRPRPQSSYMPQPMLSEEQYWEMQRQTSNCTRKEPCVSSSNENLFQKPREEFAAKEAWRKEASDLKEHLHPTGTITKLTSAAMEKLNYENENKNKIKNEIESLR